MSTIIGETFYSLPRLNFKMVLDDPEQIAPNLNSYINAFSPDIRLIFEHFDFGVQVSKMNEKNVRRNIYLIKSKSLLVQA